jgi:hypothetical protein
MCGNVAGMGEPESSVTDRAAPVAADRRKRREAAAAHWRDLREMLADERAHVDALRRRDAEAARLNPDGQPIGLALSGGGIRSATFSLGVVQALAQRGLLRRIDYLSTVSGGGYIGAWLLPASIARETRRIRWARSR